MVTIKGFDTMPRSCSQCRFCEVQKAYDLGGRALRLFCVAEFQRVDAVDAMQEREEFCPLQEVEEKTCWTLKDFTPEDMERYRKEVKEAIQMTVFPKGMLKEVANCSKYVAIR